MRRCIRAPGRSLEYVSRLHLKHDAGLKDQNIPLHINIYSDIIADGDRI